jgi:hypothetical protein
LSNQQQRLEGEGGETRINVDLENNPEVLNHVFMSILPSGYHSKYQKSTMKLACVSGRGMCTERFCVCGRS